jgi:hypothetical protein
MAHLHFFDHGVGEPTDPLGLNRDAAAGPEEHWWRAGEADAVGRAGVSQAVRTACNRPLAECYGRTVFPGRLRGPVTSNSSTFGPRSLIVAMKPDVSGFWYVGGISLTSIGSPSPV